MGKQTIMVGNQLKAARGAYWKRIGIFFTIFLLIVGAGLGIFFGFIDKADIRDIYNGDDFVNAIKYNSLMKNTDTYTLKDDVVLNERHLNELFEIDGTIGSSAGESGACFYGTLDGAYVVAGQTYYHTLTVKLSKETDEDLSLKIQPLFYKIEEDARIQNIDITFDIDDYKVKRGVETTALLARINKGTVKNVSVIGAIDTSEAVVGENDCSAIGGMFVYNYGVILGCTVDISFKVNTAFCIEGDSLKSAVWNCYVGAVAAINLNTKATTEEDVSTVTIKVLNTADFAVLTRTPYNQKGNKNDKFGLAFGYNAQDLKGKITVNDANPVYLRNASDAALFEQN